jgi:uncharacterized membrane protein YfcA
MRDLFLGKKLHWAVIVAVVAALYWLGSNQFHRVDYPAFLFAMLGISVAALIAVVLTSRRGERVTREPLEDDDPA